MLLGQYPASSCKSPEWRCKLANNFAQSATSPPKLSLDVESVRSKDLHNAAKSLQFLVEMTASHLVSKGFSAVHESVLKLVGNYVVVELMLHNSKREPFVFLDATNTIRSVGSFPTISCDLKSDLRTVLFLVCPHRRIPSRRAVEAGRDGWLGVSTQPARPSASPRLLPSQHLSFVHCPS